MKNWYRRPLPMLIGGVALLLLGLLVSAYIHDNMLQRKFGKVRQGMREQDVLHIVGRTSRTGQCGELGGFPDGCSREYIYNPWLPTITTWAVFFDEQGTVLETYRYVSP